MKNYTESSGNVFKDMGLPHPEERLAKARIALLINDMIEERGLTQKEAAEVLGLTQPKVSALKNGRLAGFSLERLFVVLGKLGCDVEVVISPRLRG
jgi:predicted XRE-type DNA-binding protein